MSTITDDFLEHYGVKGMKWGVIRKDPSAGPSRREVRNTANYLEKGYDLEMAQKKARGRMAVENTLLVAGGVAVTAIAGYAAYQAGSRFFGGVNLPMGTPVHHVNVHGPDLNIVDKPMFVAFDKKDQKFYDSVFANFAKNRARAENVYKSTLHATTDIRAPSNFEARKIYKEFAKAKGLTESYSEFNYSFNGEGLGSPRLKRQFAELMRQKGYNAMVDNFDTMKSTRIRTNRPTILFDPTKAVKKVDDILLDSGKVSLGAAKYELLSVASKAAVSPKSLALTLAVGLAGYGNHRSTERPREQRVDDYKKQNPGTKLSDAEIYNLVGYKA